jgi:hypothetical protein
MARYNLDGYSIKIWALKNKGAIKWLLAGFITLTSAKTGAWSVMIGAASKFLLDGIDYWLSE